MKRILKIILPVFLLCALSSLTWATGEEEFWHSIEAGDYQKAAETAVVLGRDTPEYYYLAGVCFQNVFNYEESNIYINCYKKNSASGKLKELLVEKAEERNNHPQILLLEGIIATIEPDLGLGDPNYYLKKAQKKLRNNAYVYNYLGLCAMNQNNYSKSVENYIEKAMRLKPDFPEPYNNLAVIRHRNGQDEEGVEILIASLEKCKLVPINTYQNLVALASFPVGLIISPCDGGGEFYQCFAPALKDEYFERIKSLPNSINLLELAEVYVRQGNSRTAAALIRDRDFTDDSGLYHYLRFYIANIDGDHERLRTYANMILQEGKLDYRRLFECGNILMHSKCHDLATLFYQTAAEKVHPDDAHYKLIIFSNMGTSYYHSKEYTLAIETLEKALAYKPDDVITLENLGLSYRDLGDKLKAVECFEKALSCVSDPEHQAYLEKLLVELEADK
ncbi:MAG TPA: tetratricopeptide repeat protein [Firmicutes bacterium]|nr:tetratricopeptide repeat protein [Bacillota bacterium]